MSDIKEWNVKASCYAKNTFNPIRNIVENLKIVPNPDKPMIALSIGDPTVFGNLKPAEEIIEAVVDAVRSGKCNGYGPSTGSVAAREAIAEYCSTPTAQVKAEDVIMCSGCSCALDIAITAMCAPGQNLLVPRPGFPLYKTLAEGLGIQTKYYNLLPENNWEVDVDMLERMIDSNTAAIVINNPSNPCGSVFSKNHLLDILDVAQRHKIPIIADEIYDNFVFKGQEFHWMASLSTEVPILSCGGLTKRFLVPGWRTGWITVHDRNGILAKEVRQGLQNLSQRIIGSNTLVQGAVPTILRKTPEKFFSDTIEVVEANARLSFSILNSTKGLHPIMPQGAMYMMVRVDMECFPMFEDDLQLVEKMISEESVFCLPGKCFSLANYVRVVLTVPEEQMMEACERIKHFCETHYQSTASLHRVPIKNGIAPITNGIKNGITNGTTKENTNGIKNHHSNGVNCEDISIKIDLTEAEIHQAKVSALLKRDIIAAELDEE